MEVVQEFTVDSFFDYLIEDPHAAVVAVDSTGHIIYCNQTYCRVLGLSRKEALGEYIGHLTPNTGVIKVLKNGKPNPAYVFSANGRDFIAASYPIEKDGRLIGVVARSVFLEMEEAFRFTDTINNFEQQLQQFKEELQQQQARIFDFSNIVGQCSAFQRAKSVARNVADTDSTVLLTGETGTGKELFAKAIHSASSRKQFPFVRVNCAAIPEHLLESELFGYEEGAFTGARKGGKKGKFELANKGTIFLDEIGEMPLYMQSKLLIVLQEKEIERLGSLNDPVKVDVRIIAATNRNLHEMIAQGTFRQDLFYRLNVIKLDIPPLRHRKGDINLLVKHFLAVLNERLETNVYNIESEVLTYLYEYDWPGNVRELANNIERAILLARMEGNNTLQLRHFPELTSARPSPVQPVSPIDTCLKDYMETCEKNFIQNTLTRCNGDKTLAANMLNIHLSVLYKKIKKYELDARVT